MGKPIELETGTVFFVLARRMLSSGLGLEGEEGPALFFFLVGEGRVGGAVDNLAISNFESKSQVI